MSSSEEQVTEPIPKPEHPVEEKDTFTQQEVIQMIRDELYYNLNHYRFGNQSLEKRIDKLEVQFINALFVSILSLFVFLLFR